MKIKLERLWNFTSEGDDSENRMQIYEVDFGRLRVRKGWGDLFFFQMILFLDMQELPQINTDILIQDIFIKYSMCWSLYQW